MGCLKQNKASRRQIKRGEVAVGPGPRECTAGYETNSCGELNIRLRAASALGEGGVEHGRMKVGTPRFIVFSTGPHESPAGGFESCSY